ncbi:hypothetical protein [Nocardioides sp. AE5]|uniref:hypothetical protein n=1 Tax=Nocardioides sp. AE5 TaxID=2962573 RepID=UPI0028814E43|nr:hypothetical protein [Nocardioides sp. AE5]MDT0200563.1 hypothetical protein [Nocardioides sp. AE5]
MDVEFDAWVNARSKALQRFAYLLADPGIDPGAIATLVTTEMAATGRRWHRFSDVDAADLDVRRRIVRATGAAPQHAALVLHLHEDHGADQVAEVLDCTERAARTHLARALAAHPPDTVRQEFAARVAGLDPAPLEVTAPPPAVRRPRTVLLAVAVVAALALGVGIGWRLVGDRAPAADANGCPRAHPAQAGGEVRPARPFLIERMAHVDRFVVCQYAVGDPDQPGLMGSRVLDADASARVLAAIRQARTGGGPDEAPECTQPEVDEDVLVLRLHTADGTEEAYVRTKLCRGNGIDDGTHVRLLTRDDCAPLWRDEVRWTGGGDLVEEPCAPT